MVIEMRVMVHGHFCGNVRLRMDGVKKVNQFTLRRAFREENGSVARICRDALSRKKKEFRYHDGVYVLNGLRPQFEGASAHDVVETLVIRVLEA